MICSDTVSFNLDGCNLRRIYEFVLSAGLSHASVDSHASRETFEHAFTPFRYDRNQSLPPAMSLLWVDHVHCSLSPLAGTTGLQAWISMPLSSAIVTIKYKTEALLVREVSPLTNLS